MKFVLGIIVPGFMQHWMMEIVNADANRAEQPPP